MTTANVLERRASPQSKLFYVDPADRACFFRPHRGQGVRPEYRLMAAVLEDALDVMRRPPIVAEAAAVERWETEAWFASPRRDWPFAFVAICEALGLDAQAVRARIAMLANGGIAPLRVAPVGRSTGTTGALRAAEAAVSGGAACKQT